MGSDPMSDADLERMRARVAAGYKHLHRYGDSIDCSFGIAQVLRLIDEIDRLRAELAAWREIGQVVTANNGPLVGTDYGYLLCGCCDGDASQWPAGKEAKSCDAFIHSPDCPVTRARALLGGEK